MKRLGVILILVLAFFGVADSAYVAQHEVANEPLVCDIQHLSGCNVVAESAYSRVLGIPVAEYGLLFYGIVFAVAALELVVFDRLLRRVLQWLATFGILASLYFTFLQVFVIRAFCVYCLASAVIMFVILVLASMIEPLRRTVRSKDRPPLTMPPAA